MVTNTNNSGFTLIELLVGSFLLVVITLLVNNILFNVFKGTTKSEVLKEVKQNGDYALSVMERMIRGARKIDTNLTPCDGTSRSQLSIISLDPDDPDQDEDRHRTTFQCLSDPLDPTVLRIASSSASRSLITPPVPEDLILTSSENVSLTGSNCTNSSLKFTCSLLSGGVTQVKIEFTLKQKGTAARKEEEAIIPFQTTVGLRNVY